MLKQNRIFSLKKLFASFQIYLSYHFVKHNVNRFDNYKCIEAQSKLDGFFESCYDESNSTHVYLISIFQIQNSANIFMKQIHFLEIRFTWILMSLNLVDRIRIQYTEGVIIIQKLKMYTNKIFQTYRAHAQTHTEWWNIKQ